MSPLSIGSLFVIKGRVEHGPVELAFEAGEEFLYKKPLHLLVIPPAENVERTGRSIRVIARLDELTRMEK